MSLDTSKSIRQVTYNGVEIPLSGGDGLPELPAPSTWSSSDFILDKDYQISKPTADTMWELPRDYRIIITNGAHLIVQSYEITEFDNYGQIILNSDNGAFTCYPVYYAESSTITSPDGIRSKVTLYGTDGLYISGEQIQVFLYGDSDNLRRLVCERLCLGSDIETFESEVEIIVTDDLSIEASSSIIGVLTTSCGRINFNPFSTLQCNTNFEVGDSLYIWSNKIILTNGYSFTYSGDAADIYAEGGPFIFNFGGNVTGVPSQYIADVGIKTPLSITENGTYTAPAGVAYSPVSVNVPNPSTGKLNITDTGIKNVTNYAQAQVVDANLVAGNIKKNVTILGKTGTYEGGTAKAKFVATTLPSSTYWRSVTYGIGKFVAVAHDSNKAAYSTNGINWTATTLPSSEGWYSVTYGNGKFVAVAYNSNKAAYSTNGINWTAVTLPSSAYWFSVTYGNGKFVAITNNNSNKAAYSTNGINWTTATLPSSSNWFSVTYGNDKFVAITNTYSKAAYSTDGINWTATTLPSSACWDSVTYGNGKFVVVASSSIKAAYSTDGINWTTATLPSGYPWSSVTYGNGKFVAIMYSNKAAYSTDGINWTDATLPSSVNWASVTYGNGKFVVVAENNNKAAYCDVRMEIE